MDSRRDFLFWFNYYNKAYPSHVARYLAYMRCFGNRGVKGRFRVSPATT